jgi:hypothetical protein
MREHWVSEVAHLKSGDHVPDEAHQAREIVETLGRGTSTTYPGMPWEPKASFRAVADFYAHQQNRPGQAST